MYFWGIFGSGKGRGGGGEGKRVFSHFMRSKCFHEIEFTKSQSSWSTITELWYILYTDVMSLMFYQLCKWIFHNYFLSQLDNFFTVL